MTASPEALVRMLGAITSDDEHAVRLLMRRFPYMIKMTEDLSSDEKERLSDVQKRTNHFYHTKEREFGLVVVDRPSVRALVRESKVEDYIYWGSNSDSVSVCTAAHIANLMKTSDKHKTPEKALAVFEDMKASTAAMTSTHAKKRKR